MPRPILRALAAAAALALAPVMASAQQRDGTPLDIAVLEAGSKRPVSGARVHIPGVPAVVTGPDGRARITSVPHGTRMVTVSRVGYEQESLTVEFGRDPVQAEVDLRPQAVELPGLRVTSWGRITKLRNNGYYDRERMGMGTFMDRDEVERRRATRMIDVFRQVRGLQVIATRTGRPAIISSRGSCKAPPKLYMDGVQMSDPDNTADPSNFVQPEQVEAIEVYSGPASIPPQYNITGNACGVILIWTRTSR